MKKIMTILMTVLTYAINFAQITTIKNVPKTEQVNNTPYDSTVNFLGKNVYGFVGQDLYLIGIEEGKNYKFFFKNLKFDSDGKGNIYKPTYSGSEESKYKDLAEKYFTVLEVIKVHINSPLGEDSYFLKLQEKENKEILYFKYNMEYDTEFPFVTVGYFLKEKNMLIGKQYITRGVNWNMTWKNYLEKPPITDINTALPIKKFEIGSIWTVVDVSTVKRTSDNFGTCIVLILENSIHEHVSLPIELTEKSWAVIEKKSADAYKQHFGEEIWNLILNKQVKIGMTEEMCILSWGDPRNTNQTITDGKKSEQWVYPENRYLYFENNILTAIQ